jgi:hypothetical protein
MWLSLMLAAWAAFLLAGFMTYEALAPRTNHFVRWVVGVVTLALSVIAAKRFQKWLLTMVDPDGERGREIRELFE